MQQEYQDAMATVAKKGKPDLSSTYTCNPKTKEIVKNLLPGQTASERPNLVSRVFNQNLEKLKSHLSKHDLLGIHVIEFQKR